MFQKLKDKALYLWNMFTEPSSLASIGAGVTAGAALSPPYSYVIITLAVFGVLRQETGKPRDPDASKEQPDANSSS